MRLQLLGGLSPRAFLRRYWQKRPLFVPRALPGFGGVIDKRALAALAVRDDVESRIVERHGKRRETRQGPFEKVTLAKGHSTLLVSGVNLHLDAADALLRRFAFVPQARLDDVMVSYATPGGGVGPHVDSYDVFLLQGHGRRRWQISGQKDHSFVPGLDLKILERFAPEREMLLEAGDMLYLPPGVAHHGVAESECLTWSIGFRAPNDAELVAGFLDFLHERLEPRGQYGDAGEAPARHPGEIPARLLEHAERAMDAIGWTPAQVREFAGRFLSDPKAQVYFTAPRRALARAQFARRCAATGLALDARSRLLFSGTMFFLNGEVAPAPAKARTWLSRLADERRLEGAIEAPAEFWDLAHAWYLQGFLHPGEEK